MAKSDFLVEVTFKGPLSGMSQFLKTKSSSKVMKNEFYLNFKALFVPKIF